MTHHPHPYLPPPQAPRPGALPLRFLGLGDYFEGLFRIIGFGPMATLSPLIASQAVGALAMILGSGVIFSDVLYFLSSGFEAAPPVPTAGQLTGGLVLTLAGFVVMLLGQLVATAFGTITTVRAASNQRTSLSDAWALFRPRAGRFLFLFFLILAPIGFLAFAVATALMTAWTILLVEAIDYGTGHAGLWILPLAGLALLAGFVWLWIKLSVALNALAVEDISATGAIRRSWRLTGSQWWRVFGILLLFSLIVGSVIQLVGIPVQMASGFSDLTTDGTTVTALIVIGFVLYSAISGGGAALQTVVTAILYTDLRFRKDALHEAIWADVAAGRIDPLPHSVRPDVSG